MQQYCEYLYNVAKEKLAKNASFMWSDRVHHQTKPLAFYNLFIVATKTAWQFR